MYWIYFIIFIIWNENILYDLSTSIFYICLSLDLSYTLHEKKKIEIERELDISAMFLVLKIFWKVG